MKLVDINKRYIDDVLEYYIKEIYNMIMSRRYDSESKHQDINKMLIIRMNELIEMSFIIDYKINVNVNFLNKSEIRDAILDDVLNDIEYKEGFIEVFYKIKDRSMYNVSISEEELINYTPPF